MSDDFQVLGTNAAALFTLKIHRGDGMALLGMNWKKGKPPRDFVGFAIEYKEPGGTKFFALKNRIAFPDSGGKVNPNQLSTMLSPIQKFRWVHFPRNADLDGEFIYRVTPVFMNEQNELSYGDAQSAAIELRRDTYPGKLNITFTRGFVSSQAFVDRYAKDGPISKLVPDKADKGLTFKPTHPDRSDAYAWMGFEAREQILATLDEAIKDKADVYAIAYDLNLPEVVDRFKKMGKRLKIVIDDSKDHKPAKSAESAAEKMLKKTAGAVKRQHMSHLQHNKTIVVDGKNVKKVICGSTNLSWRGFFVQNNNAMVLQGAGVVKLFRSAFENYFNNQTTFRETPSAKLTDIGLSGINARVAFSPHSDSNAMLDDVAKDILRTGSSLLYSLAFLYESPGAVHDAVVKATKNKNIFVYGISDKHVGGLDLTKPDGNVSPVFASALTKNVPAPFSEEPTGGANDGGGGTRMHHKFVVIDFDKPTARVYFGSYNFSNPADLKNGENLLLVRDRRVAVSYMIEALRIFDHYHFRVAQMDAKKARKQLVLARPPRKSGEKPWWAEDYSDRTKILDRELFS
jgi:phosphatidylserine/phosphatidylglycerophosphate/cardiolipin synthase-like enzyme